MPSFGSAWLQTRTATMVVSGQPGVHTMWTKRRYYKRRLLVDRFKGWLRDPTVLRMALLILRIVDVVLRAFDWLN